MVAERQILIWLKIYDIVVLEYKIKEENFIHVWQPNSYGLAFLVTERSFLYEVMKSLCWQGLS